MRWFTARVLGLGLWLLAGLLGIVRLIGFPFGYAFGLVGRAIGKVGQAIMDAQTWSRLKGVEFLTRKGAAEAIKPWIAAEPELSGLSPLSSVRPRNLFTIFLVAGAVLFGIWWQVGRVIRRLGRLCQRASRGIERFTSQNKLAGEIRRFRREARKIRRDITQFSLDQQAANPLDPEKPTILLTITCGQAVRNFLLSDCLGLLRARFNVVILTTYAYSEGFRKEYSLHGVHVLPWFNSFRTSLERIFQYYFMSRSPSRTHQSWLANLELRAKSHSNRARFRRLILMRRFSDLLGAAIGSRGMQGLYASYFMAYLPKSLFTFLLSTYRPQLVISTTAHHAEAWPLTYFARRHGVKTLANILSWDNTTTKPIMDVCCDYYAVWSDEMREEFVEQFPHIATEVVVTGCPLFDVYYQKPYAESRPDFLAEVGLSPDKPYILYATNTPAAMPDECQVIEQYWDALGRSPLADQISMLVRLHPKETIKKYESLLGRKDLVVTLAAEAHWSQSDRWLPNHEDMRLLLNSMMHAAVSVNVASTMSLESFALDLPTINIAFKSSDDVKDHGSMWSFDMYHFSEHYHAIIDNGSVDLARSVDELVAFTKEALENPNRHAAAMRKTLKQKAAHCDGTSALRFFEVVKGIVDAPQPQRLTGEPGTRCAAVVSASHPRIAEAAE